MADSRCAPAAGMPGVVSRAVSACTAIIEMWWATTSCSSRAIRARSPRALCSSRSRRWLRGLRCILASSRRRTAAPASANVGISAASRGRAAFQEPIGPASANNRNGNGRPMARTCGPVRPSRYNDQLPSESGDGQCPKRQDDNNAADTAIAAAAVRGAATGSVVVSASRQSTTPNSTPSPLPAARAIASTPRRPPGCRPRRCAPAGSPAVVARPPAIHSPRP